MSSVFAALPGDKIATPQSRVRWMNMMNRLTINGELSLRCPEGFETMSAEELDRVYTSKAAGRLGIWDRERRVMITALWQRYNPLLTWLSDMKALAKRNEQLTRRCYQENGYRLDGFFSRRVCGLAGEGYRYGCRLGDTDREIETVLVKKGGVVYSLSCIGRPEDREANHALFDAILDGTL